MQATAERQPYGWVLCPLERTRLIAERTSLLAKWSVFAQQPRFRANALHLTLRVRLLAMSAAFDFRKCKRLLLSSLAVSALYRGPRGILCTRGEKEYASIRQPTAACDNRLVKNEAYDDSPRKFICAEDVDGQNVTLTGLLTAHTALLKSHYCKQ